MSGAWEHESEVYRLATRADLPDFERMLADPEVGRWLWFTPLPEGATQGFFGPLIDQQQKQAAAGEVPTTAVITVEDREGNFLGQGGVVAVDMSPGGFEVGFQLSRAAWGRGVGTRLGRFLCAYAITQCDAVRIQGGCLEGNHASQALLKKLGLVLEGRHPGYRLKGDERHTELVFGRLVSDLDSGAYRQVARTVGLVT